MAKFNIEFKKILKNLEDNITDKKSLDLVKVEMFNMYNLFFDEITELEQTTSKRMAQIAQTQLNMEEKLKDMDKSIKNIEKDIYMEDDMEQEDCDIEVKCPYCNETFTTEINDINATEIVCPECKNTIELDWGTDCDCEDDCNCCSDNKHHCDCKDEEDDM